ncbi:hypothetical protein [Paenibacillus protaetiae]|uniref:Uncharacterized protein n=1 Tax=Paenibacillus protaetiae TaxID=2509456 RepID=A0A4P6EVQ2_9BACL|nr:hypothetical protein [Paenibacillus protaetiae]QAY67380.1 hypothetical protein ET464_14240 [Paenibacillus protaetiae]
MRKTYEQKQAPPRRAALVCVMAAKAPERRRSLCPAAPRSQNPAGGNKMAAYRRLAVTAAGLLYRQNE